MYILVNYSDYYGLSCFGKFDSHKEAYKHIADDIMEYYIHEQNTKTLKKLKSKS